jgi:Trk K+ transport system NAD-binding subunit
MSETVVVVGTDDYDIGAAIEETGFEVTSVDIGNRPALEEAGIVDAAVVVVTEADQATSISVAKDLNPELKVVVYADDSLPDFARGQTDLVLDPELFDPDAVAGELDA